MVFVRFALHNFVSVLVIGTLWRMLAYHAVASPSSQVQHLGTAMLQQY